MARHEAARRPVREWMRDYRRQMIGPRVAIRLIRQDPGLLWWLLISLVAAYGLLLVARTVLVQLDSFQTSGIDPGLLAGGLFGDRLAQRRDESDVGRSENRGFLARRRGSRVGPPTRTTASPPAGKMSPRPCRQYPEARSVPDGESSVDEPPTFGSP